MLPLTRREAYTRWHTFHPISCLMSRGITKTLIILPCLLAISPAVAKEGTADTVSLIFVGDIMIAHDQETGKLIERGVDPFEPCANLLKNADAAIGNLECVVAEKGDRVKKPYNFRADPSCIPLLKQHFSALSVANNHSGDFGKAAFAEQCDRLDLARIPYFGGARTKADAHKPWIVDHHGVRIAMLGYCEVYLKSFQAQENVPGVAWSEHDDEVLADIRTSRKKFKADVVIPFMHWGDENEPPSDRQKSFARKMINAGADVVVGSHPHVTQRAEYYKGHLIVYSLGNFLFSGFDDPDNLTGWALHLTVNKKGMAAWNTIVVRLNEHGVPHPDLKTKSPSGRCDSKQIELTAYGRK
jgi:poly-gamma-glutamate capsule biosynthesis protein CapA/YwtB (metallophosphatase superfamily)